MFKPLSRLLIILLTLSLLAGCVPASDAPAATPTPEAVSAETLPELTLLTPVPESGTSEIPDSAPESSPPSVTSEPTAVPEPSAAPVPTASPVPLDEHGTYTHRDDVALFIHLFGRLPDNFISKTKARKLGWPGGSLEPYAPGKCIGGGEYQNLEGLLPDAPGRVYHECDIDTLGKKSRGSKRIVYSNDGLIYYTDDHYESFTLLYVEE